MAINLAKAGHTYPPIPAGYPALLSIPAAARLLGYSTRKIRELIAADLFPAPVNPGGGQLRFLTAELLAWAEHGCKPREEWEAIKRGAKR